VVFVGAPLQESETLPLKPPIGVSTSRPCGPKTTLNVYTRTIRDAQRHAVDKTAEVLFTNVHKISVATENQNVN
jgi:hypothetical protein